MALDVFSINSNNLLVVLNNKSGVVFAFWVHKSFKSNGIYEFDIVPLYLGYIYYRKCDIVYTQSKGRNSGPYVAAPKKAHTILLARMERVTVFWDSQGEIYLNMGKMITIFHYVDLLGWYDEGQQQKRPELAKKTWLFHHGNAQVHTSIVPIAKLGE